ncbi:MAG: hypothetical protein HZA66_06485 [Rhodopseudomonas palustris]|uniref:N-acyl amino acid synthase FeeM catalytic core domain-containing protein n=1 Tax=Rhodopseudomonas palustris TaxID=1076 RepID=A0A933RUX6_RHOPL|nr:hypothetical protein [Rhodopseudomonas palustris]
MPGRDSRLDSRLDSWLDSWGDADLASVWPSAAMTSGDARIGIARTRADLISVGRLRYERYVAREGKQYGCTDHVGKTFIEPLDRLSLNFFATVNGRVAGAVRLVRASDAPADRHLALLVEAARPADPATTVVNSRFAVRPEMAARALIVPMFQQVYRSGLLAGARQCLLATRTELIPLFGKFGFVPLGRTLNDPVAGHLEILALDAFDFAHLASVASPYLPIARSLLGRLVDAEDAAGRALGFAEAAAASDSLRPAVVAR